MGTDLPLLLGMLITCRLDAASTLILFGFLQILTGVYYGLPMPVQPLKAMAVIMITREYSGSILYGGGLAIGFLMLLLTLTGLLKWLVKVTPKSVVRGIQFGLGVSLASLALSRYVSSEGYRGYVLSSLGFAFALYWMGNRKYPPAVFLMILGGVYALFFHLPGINFQQAVGFALPKTHVPGLEDILQGFLLLSLPQLPLSITNSVIATHQTLRDLFPQRAPKVEKIGFTYSLMNLLNPFFSGIPTCHGAGGVAGHYVFGARTGGSVVIYGFLYLVVGFFFSRGFEEILRVFPLPILGVILLFEGIMMMLFIRDIADSRYDLFICLLVALLVVGLPYGYVIGFFIGSFLYYLKIPRGIGK